MQTSRFKRLLFVVITGAFCALATSCGGGGGGEPPPVPAVPTVIAVWDTPAASWDNVIWQ